MVQEITKAVFPVAGLGTRFLPATKACPKEMLPVVDKPLIQLAVEEAIAAGITELIFITGRTKQAIVDHFGSACELEAELEKRNKMPELEMIRNIVPDNVACIFIKQLQPLGLGHAVLCAEPVVGNNPFAVILPDDLIEDGTRGVIRQMIYEYERYGGGIIAVEHVSKTETGKYGIVSIAESRRGEKRLEGIVEKPHPDSAPSSLAVVGRYILTAKIFEYLKMTEQAERGEIQLTDAIAGLIVDEPVHAYEFEGTRYDCGSKFGYIKASIDYALNDPDIGENLAAYIKDRMD